MREEQCQKVLAKLRDTPDIEYGALTIRINNHRAASIEVIPYKDKVQKIQLN